LTAVDKVADEKTMGRSAVKFLLSFFKEVAMSVAVSRLFKFVIGLGLTLIAAVPASAQEFYKGKTIVLIVGTAAGGGFDTYSRMLARHFGKYLPGNPNIVVQNMPGAGQLIAANHLYNRSQPDGLTVGHFSGSVIFRHVLGDQSVMFDGRKFGVPSQPNFLPSNMTL